MSVHETTEHETRIFKTMPEFSDWLRRLANDCDVARGGVKVSDSTSTKTDGGRTTFERKIEIEFLP